MKITGVKTMFADGGRRVFVFVKVETDQPGLVGWGEASLEAKPRAVAGCVADMEPMILGEDPCRIEYICQIYSIRQGSSPRIIGSISATQPATDRKSVV